MTDIDKITNGLELTDCKITGISQKGSIADVELTDDQWTRIQITTPDYIIQNALFLLGQRVKVIVRPWTDEEKLEEELTKLAAVVARHSDHGESGDLQHLYYDKIVDLDECIKLDLINKVLERCKDKDKVRDWFAPELRPEMQEVFSELDNIINRYPQGPYDNFPPEKIAELKEYVEKLGESEKKPALIYVRRFVNWNDYNKIGS